jgi:hypothetical protein
MRISDMLWSAANEHLCSAIPGQPGASLAVRFQTDGALFWTSASDADIEEAEDFLAVGMGWNELDFLWEFKAGEERQGARYLGLDFARLVAEEEGL